MQKYLASIIETNLSHYQNLCYQLMMLILTQKFHRELLLISSQWVEARASLNVIAREHVKQIIVNVRKTTNFVTQDAIKP